MYTYIGQLSLLFLVAFLCTTPLTKGEAICENGFEDMPGHYFSGRCYATSAIRDQETAGMVAPICVRYSPQQGQMLSIYDSSVNKFVQKLLKDGKMQASWIGLSVSNSVFVWSDQSHATYLNLAKDSTHPVDNSCYMVNASDGLWYQHDCGSTLHFICQYNPNFIPTPKPTPPPPAGSSQVITITIVVAVLVLAVGGAFMTTRHLLRKRRAREYNDLTASSKSPSDLT